MQRECDNGFWVNVWLCLRKNEAKCAEPNIFNTIKLSDILMHINSLHKDQNFRWQDC